jgi:hypothetical protein
MMNMLFNLLWEAIGLALLCVPLIWELWNDKDGDAHISRAEWNANVQMLSKKVDIFARCTMAITASVVNYVLGINSIIPSLFMSGAIHFLIFDYAIVYILIKNGVISPFARWWDYLGTKGMDNYEWWKGKSWQVRMVIKIAVFIIACLIYF